MKILIVDDSIMIRTLLKTFFTENGEEVIGEASNGKKAVELTKRLDPDIITLDIDMPIMNGIDAAREILSTSKKPIVIFAGELTPDTSAELFQLGVAEVMEKPPIDRFYNRDYTDRFLQRMRTLVHDFKRASVKEAYKSPAKYHSEDTEHKAKNQREFGAPVIGRTMPEHRVDVVVMGASTGGPDAVRTILSSLPETFPVGIILVQHIEIRFSTSYAQWLDGYSKLNVISAKNGIIPERGNVYIAPGNAHTVLIGGKIKLDDGPPVKNQKPAVEELFRSAAEDFGSAVMGVLLTGMGTDGTDGSVAIRRAGGFMLVQDKSTSFIYGMPKSAIEAGGASIVLPLPKISIAMMEAVHVHR